MKKMFALLMVCGWGLSEGYAQANALSTQLHAAAQAAQGERVISLQLNDTPLSQALETVVQKFGYGLLLQSDRLPERKISVSFESVTLSQALAQLLNDTQLEAVISKNGDVWVREKTIPATPSLKVSGKVVDEQTGEPLPGVNIRSKNTNVGTITNTEGAFTLEVPDENAVLVFSFVGYRNAEMVAGKQASLTVRLSPDVQALGEIVVTALGIERNRRDLGYVVQEIKGSQIDQARETNFVNALAGKVAGVQVVQSSTGIGGSARITIRGESSLNLNNNSPLFVVDGIPITNQNPAYGGASVDFGGGDIPHDFGNAASEINPDDVASITVLKGPNAAALYGARAANGAILITTKSGKKTQGFGVSVNSGITFERTLRLPDYQNVYGGGLNPDAYTLYDVPPANPLQAGNSGGYSWGPRMNGQLFKQFGSPVLPNNDREPIPFLPQPGNVSDFFQTGITSNQNVALAYGGENANFRLSYTRMDQKGTVPNTDLSRNLVALKAGAQLHRTLRVDASINYANSGSSNLPTSGYGPASHMYNFIWEERNANLDWYRNYWVSGLEGIQQRNNLTFADNIYFMTHETISPFDKHRVYGNVRASLDITDQLMLQLRSGIDTYSEVRRTRKAFSALRRPQGMYRFQEVAFLENNTDFLLRYRPETGGLFSLETSLGGNLMHQSNRVATATNVSLAIPGVYNIGNAEAPTQLNESDQQKSIYSLYALAQIGFRKFLFLDITARNDWSSTLPKGNNAYFYPSVGLSGNITDVADLSKLGISFLKLRASWAQVGNDTDPYQLQQFYNYSLPWGSNAAVTNRSLIANAGLKPEITTSYELGTDLHFFSDRLNIDFTLYNIRSRNQIIPVPLSNTTGFTSKLLNAGEIVNRGIEVMLNATPVKLSSGFSWNINVNFSRNRGEVVELAPGVDSYLMGLGPGTAVWGTVEARPGQRMGDMYGFGYQRDPAGNIIWSSNAANARPLRTATTNAYGNYNPDWMAGIYNTFSWKGFELGVLFDHRQGGHVYSFTHANGSLSGSLEHTLPGRETGIVPSGVYQVNENTFAPLTVNLNARDYYGRLYDRGIIEGNLFDATFTKLREVKFGYRFPNSFTQAFGIRNLGLFLVGRNLLLWTKVPHIDPEVMALNGGTFTPGFEVTQLPSTRSLGFNLSFQF